MSELVFDNVQKVFPGGVTAVEGFTLTIPEPRMTVLVGPSGCGKTTLLRLIAGLDRPTAGAIYLDGARLDTLPPKDRDIAMVFQSYALYPHMSVEENLSFGLRLRKIPKDQIAGRVLEVAKALEIDGLLKRKPGALSGGQRQRVALGRAIIREPRVFLFDEPLSNLDARLRVEMRATIKKLYHRLKVTSVYVTHDQVEAMTIGELLVVMHQGRIHQVGTPDACYFRPADTFVASFLGSPPMNFLEGRRRAGGIELAGAENQTILLPVAGAGQAGGASSGAVTVGFRPEDVRPAPKADKTTSVRLNGRIVLKEPLGHETLTHIQYGSTEIIARGSGEFTIGNDGQAAMYVDGASFHIFSRPGGERLDTD